MVNSSPVYPKSNGLAESAVKIIKSFFKNCDDPYLGLLAYRNTPLTGLAISPAQMSMGRNLRSTLPLLTEQLTPRPVPTAVVKEMFSCSLRATQLMRREEVPVELAVEDQLPHLFSLGAELLELQLHLTWNLRRSPAYVWVMTGQVYEARSLRAGTLGDGDSEFGRSAYTKNLAACGRTSGQVLVVGIGHLAALVHNLT
ncbi:hypothetical protein B566_EDAN013764, partial [Ephemera danica]